MPFTVMVNMKIIRLDIRVPRTQTWSQNGVVARSLFTCRTSSDQETESLSRDRYYQSPELRPGARMALSRDHYLPVARAQT